MPTVIPVKFKYAARDLWFDVAGSEAQEADHVICSTERGTEIGIATADAREMSQAELDEATNRSRLRPVLRVATDEDLDLAEDLAEKGDEALPVFRRLVSESGLDMKPVGVEYLFDGSKAVCYFAAEDRVDFRQLVRDLARELHERIDMRQIGVREESAIVGGYGHCGQELCCSRFGLSFEPVSIRMAKEQDLPLNSSKISGACGRLMCCLRYEFEAYRDFKGRAPKKNAVIETPLGKAKIIEYATPKEELCLRLENGKQVRVPLADMTASEAAVRKSEELGCPCRPDTVTRDILERLESPDIQMALNELDRRNGTVSEGAVNETDIFVTQPKRRRRPSSGRGAETPEAQEGDGSTSKRRRHKSRSGKGSGPEGGSDKGRATRPSSDAEGGQQGSTRRRHHSASGRQDGTRGEGGQPTQAKRTRRTRRPGDLGGQAPEQRQAPQGGPEAPEGGRQGDAPKRRRRHRGGRGRGKGGSQGSGAGGNGGTPNA